VRDLLGVSNSGTNAASIASFLLAPGERWRLHNETCFGIAFVEFDLPWLCAIKPRVEIAGLRIGVGPRFFGTSHSLSVTAAVVAGNYDSSYGDHR